MPIKQPVHFAVVPLYFPSGELLSVSVTTLFLASGITPSRRGRSSYNVATHTLCGHPEGFVSLFINTANPALECRDITGVLMARTSLHERHQQARRTQDQRTEGFGPFRCHRPHVGSYSGAEHAAGNAQLGRQAERAVVFRLGRQHKVQLFGREVDLTIAFQDGELGIE